MPGREPARAEGHPCDEERIDRAAKSAGRRLEPVRVRHHRVVQCDADLADVTASDEQAGAIVRCNNPWQRLERAKQIALRARSSIHVDRLAGEHGIDRQPRWPGGYSNAVFEAPHDEYDVDPRRTRFEERFVGLEAIERDAHSRARRRWLEDLEGAALV